MAIARADGLSEADLKRIVSATTRVTTVARWIGQATALANRFPLPWKDARGRQVYIRDSEGKRKARRPRPVAAQRELAQATPAAGSLAQCERWQRLRQRVLEKQKASREDVQGPQLLPAKMQ